LISTLAPVAGYTADDVAKTPPDRMPVTFRADRATQAELDARGTRASAAKVALRRYLGLLTLGPPAGHFAHIVDTRVLVDGLGPFVADGSTQRMSVTGLLHAVERVTGLMWGATDAVAVVDALERAHRLGGFTDDNLRAVGLLPEAE
jgi:hypothetical protein